MKVIVDTIEGDSYSDMDKYSRINIENRTLITAVVVILKLNSRIVNCNIP